MNALHHRILKALEVPPEDDGLSLVVQPWSEDLTPHIRSHFRRNLEEHLFGSDSLLSLRLRLALADFSWVVHSTNIVSHSVVFIIDSIYSLTCMSTEIRSKCASASGVWRGGPDTA